MAGRSGQVWHVGRTRTSATACPAPCPRIRSTNRHFRDRTIQEHHERRDTGRNEEVTRQLLVSTPVSPNCPLDVDISVRTSLARFRDSWLRPCSPLPTLRSCSSSDVTFSPDKGDKMLGFSDTAPPISGMCNVQVKLVEQRTCQTYLDRLGDDYSFDDTARPGLPSVVCEPLIPTRRLLSQRQPVSVWPDETETGTDRRWMRQRDKAGKTGTGGLSVSLPRYEDGTSKEGRSRGTKRCKCLFL